MEMEASGALESGKCCAERITCIMLEKERTFPNIKIDSCGRMAHTAQSKGVIALTRVDCHACQVKVLLHFKTLCGFT